MIKKHPLASFYILAFLFSWIGWAPHVAGSRGIAPFTHPAFMLTLLLAGGGPALAAMAISYVTGGKDELRALYRLLRQWRVSWGWYAAALLGPGLLFGGAAVLQAVWSGTAVSLTFSSPWYAFIPFLAGNLLINVWEEVGCPAPLAAPLQRPPLRPDRWPFVGIVAFALVFRRWASLQQRTVCPMAGGDDGRVCHLHLAV